MYSEANLIFSREPVHQVSYAPGLQKPGVSKFNKATGLKTGLASDPKSFRLPYPHLHTYLNSLVCLFPLLAAWKEWTQMLTRCATLWHAAFSPWGRRNAFYQVTCYFLNKCWVDTNRKRFVAAASRRPTRWQDTETEGNACKTQVSPAICTKTVHD